MKKKLLYFNVLFLSFFIVKLNAQTLVYDVSEIPTYGNAAAASTLKSGGNVSIDQIGTQSDATLYFQLNNSNSGLVLNNTGNDAITITSTGADIAKIVLKYSANGGSSTASPYVGYNSTPTAVGSATAATVSSCTIDATGVTGTTAAPVDYFPPAGTKYAILARGKACDAASANSSTIRFTRIEVWLEGTLPLDFTSFTAKPDALGKTVTLNWATAKENNTSNFEIQKRTDATEFATIGTLASKNTAGNHNYSFTDNNAIEGNSYYRIIQFDNNQASTSSPIVPVTIKAGAELSIFPNPVSDVLTINHAAASSNAALKVLTINGKVVAQKSVTAGSTSSSVDVSSLAPGTYMLVVDGASIKFVKK